MSRALIAVLISAGVLAGCASRGLEPVERTAPLAPRMTATRGVVYKKIDASQLRQALAAGGTVRASQLVSSVGAGFADLVAEALADRFAGTDLGRALVSGKKADVSAFLVHTEDDRDVTVLSDYALFAVGSCVKVLEQPNRSDLPRIVPASGCRG